MSQGEAYLGVVEIKALPGSSKCTMRFSYSDNKNPGPAQETADSQGGRLSFVCNKATGGTCNFDMRNGTLDVSYSNRMGGSNSATFKKIQ
jgi:hypothetical protein